MWNIPKQIVVFGQLQFLQLGSHSKHISKCLIALALPTQLLTEWLSKLTLNQTHIEEFSQKFMKKKKYFFQLLCSIRHEIETYSKRQKQHLDIFEYGEGKQHLKAIH